jgi:hypothetical protein
LPDDVPETFDNSWRRATIDTEAPGACVSATI